MVTENKNEMNVVVLTQYLAAGMNDFLGKYGANPLDGIAQIVKFGYDPDNLSAIDRFETNRNLVNIVKPGLEKSRTPKIASMDPRKTFIIAGCIEDGEEEINSLKGTGLVVARYSIFYGGPSEYSGKNPEESGYSIDIPKAVPAASALISSDDFLDGLVSRDMDQITKALSKINMGHEDYPIAITPYLSEALSARKNIEATLA